MKPLEATVYKTVPVELRAVESEHEFEALRIRLEHLEREHAHVRIQANLLASLHTDVLRIASMSTPDAAIAELLRSSANLGYARGVYFGVDRERGIEARWQIVGSSAVTPSREAPNLSEDSALLRALRGGCASDVAASDVAASDEAAPLRNARIPYVLSPLAQGATTLGILYLDGFDARLGPSPQPQLVHALARAAALAIGNSELLARAQELALLDPLTGLLNRRGLSERIPAVLESCRERGQAATYLMIDFDDLKRVNDRDGHALGDAVLKRVAQALARNSRVGDVVGRYGGDEFVVLLPCVDADFARELVVRISSELQADGLSCSIGAALYPHDATDVAPLTLAADRALYAIKAAGKNGFTFA